MKAYEQTAKQADALFDQICTKTNCDIISIDLSRRLPFFVTKTPVKLALLRGAQFELDYGSGMLEGMAKDCRKCFIANALAITKHSKGKGVILAANVNRKVFMRAPLDLVHMGQLLGVSQDEARNAITRNCVQAFQHAHYRKTHKGVAEVKWLSDKDLVAFEQDSEEDVVPMDETE